MAGRRKFCPFATRESLFAACLALATPAFAQQPSRPDLPPEHPHNGEDNGTDPTQVRRSLTLNFEHTDLRSGFRSDVFEIDYSEPLASHTSLTATLQLPSNTVAGNDGFGYGDTEIVLTHIPVVTHHYGLVFKGGVNFDTASRPELGSGNHVLEGTFIFAAFLKGGHILAPSFEYDYGLDPDSGRPRVNSLTIDFYFVPKLKDRRYYMTVDPFLAIDFEGKKQFGGLSLTLGRTLGPALGGRAQAYVKPSIYAGGDRASNWGIEAGVKLLGFHFN